MPFVTTQTIFTYIPLLVVLILSLIFLCITFWCACLIYLNYLNTSWFFEKKTYNKNELLWETKFRKQDCLKYKGCAGSVMKTDKQNEWKRKTLFKRLAYMRLHKKMYHNLQWNVFNKTLNGKRKLNYPCSQVRLRLWLLD